MRHVVLWTLLLGASIASAADLTPVEQRWIKAALPAIEYARARGLPLDLVVQPDVGPGGVPLAMGFSSGRCKMVFSLRGRPEAENILEGAADPGLLIQAMAAHEIAHCQRHASGAWSRLPSDLEEDVQERSQDPQLLALSKTMREARREEGYADLAALAWIQRERPQDYREVHAWMAAARAHPAVPRSSHDTRVWVALAQDPAALGDVCDPFESAAKLWRFGLLNDP